MPERCSVCPGVNKCVAPSGPSNAEYMLIGEAPGYDEDKGNKPFVGKTGREVNEHYLPLAGLRRDNIWVGNCISCLPTSSKGKLDPKRTKDLEMLEICASQNLYPYIERMKPKLLLPVGSFACRAIDPTIDLDLHHGIPRPTPWGIPAFPQFHPALGMHEPKKMLQIRTDWYRLKRYIKGNLYIPTDEFEGLEDYRELETAEQVHEILCGNWHMTMAGDTETTYRRKPFCLTFSITVGTGYLIRADNKEALDAFQEHLNLWKGKILFHNWLFDSRVVEEMGLKFLRRLIVDTMVRIFQLGNRPQGLKALAYRELGMTMEDFDDVVTPHSKARVLMYLRDAMSQEWERPEEQMVRDKEGTWKLYKPQSFRTKVKRFLSDSAKSPDKDPFDMWNKAWADDHGMIEKKCGEWTGKCITDTPFEKVIRYAARDSDSLLRLYPIIQKMNRDVRRKPQERWGE